MLDDFLVRSVLAGLGTAIAAGPLGCFVVWRRMAYFGDATAHAAILGVALALALSLPVFAGALAVAILMGLAVIWLGRGGLSPDSALGVLAFSALAFGLVAMSLVPGPRVDLEAFLFGDILAVSKGDLGIIWAGAVLVLALLAWRWSRLLTSTLSPDLAYASGIEPRREQLILTLALALVVAVAIKVIGALLISAMLIIPASIVRPFAATPERMAALAALAGVLAVLLGTQGALSLDTPTGPSIVCAAALLFVLSQVAAGFRR